MTVSEIAQEHGVSRQSVHSYRTTRGDFPKPVEGEGSTRPRFRADDVAAWFAANPPRPGKRTDLATHDEGAAMPQTEQQATGIEAKPDYLTQEQWTGLVYSLHEGLGAGLRKAGLRADWAVSLAPLALAAVLPRLNELVAYERRSPEEMQ
jgi:predicted DNA-binding transcriptional regulator AlpA